MSSTIRLLIVLAALSCIPLPCLAQSQPPSATATSGPDSKADLQSTLEERKLALEKEKVELEREKLMADIADKRHGYIVSIAQVLIAALALSAPIWAAVLQNRSEKEKRQQEQATQFKLKAAELAMNAVDSNLVAGRAEALKTLFSKELPADFAQNFDPNKIRFGPGREMRLELLKLLAAHPEQSRFLLTVWGIMWPGEDPKWNRDDHKNYAWWVELKKFVDTQAQAQEAPKS